MIRSLLKLLAIVVVGILVYNYFLGTPAEKSSASNIFKEFKDVGVAVKDLLKSEKEKFDSGKYDKAVDKIGQVLDGLKRTAREFDEKYLDRISELDRKRQDLRQDLEDYKQDELSGSSTKDSTQLKQGLKDLLRDTEKLIEEMDSNPK